MFYDYHQLYLNIKIDGITGLKNVKYYLFLIMSKSMSVSLANLGRQQILPYQNRAYSQDCTVFRLNNNQPFETKNEGKNFEFIILLFSAH